MTEGPTRLGQSLSEALDRLEHAIFDPTRLAENERLAKEHQEADLRDRRRERLEALGIELEKSTHRQIVADSGLKDTTSLVAVKRWLTSQHDWPMAVLSGNRGCGKSVAAAYVVANWDRSAAWSSAPDLIRVFSGNFGDQLKRQEVLKKARLLVLDDIGTEGDATRMCAALVELLDERKQRKTLITTNLNKTAFFERYADERLHSRIRELAGFVGDKGPDLRGQP
jgi:DNA replication protein DnaC